MKKLLIFLIAFTSIAVMSTPAQEFKGTNDAQVLKETRQLQSFNKLNVSKGINVTLVKGEDPKAEINIVNALTSDVIIERDQNELTIKMKTKIYKDVSVQVYLTYNDIREISVGTGASVDANHVIEGDVLTLDAGLDSVIDLKVDLNTIKASSSAARITLEGYANTVEAKANTGGKFQAQNLECQKAYVTSNTGGIVTVNVQDELDAKAGTGGNVEYLGEPKKVNTKESLGGKVNKI